MVELFPALGDRLDQVAGTLSGGEQQMCAIARGLMSRPRLMMIDELSLGLAPVLVDEIIGRLPDIAAAGTAILLVEQDVDAALTVAERAYVLETGHIVLSGQASAAAGRPADPGELPRHRLRRRCSPLGRERDVRAAPGIPGVQ